MLAIRSCKECEGNPSEENLLFIVMDERRRPSGLCEKCIRKRNKS